MLLTVGLPESTIADIEAEIKSQALALTRVAIVRKSIAHSLIIKCVDLAEAMEFSNKYAPEHLILHLHEASKVVELVTNAGSIFVGAYSPESYVIIFFLIISIANFLLIVVEITLLERIILYQLMDTPNNILEYRHYLSLSTLLRKSLLEKV